MEFQQLFTKVDNFNNNHTYTDIIKSNSVPEFNKKNHRGNQHEMANFNWKMQYIEYKKKINDAKKGFVEKVYEEMDSVNDIQTILKNEQYSKPWGRMNNYCRKVKLQEYMDTLCLTGRVEESKKPAYLKYLYTKLNDNKLKVKKDIQYDSDKQVIVSIPCIDSKLK